MVDVLNNRPPRSVSMYKSCCQFTSCSSTRGVRIHFQCVSSACFNCEFTLKVNFAQYQVCGVVGFGPSTGYWSGKRMIPESSFLVRKSIGVSSSCLKRSNVVASLEVKSICEEGRVGENCPQHTLADWDRFSDHPSSCSTMVKKVGDGDEDRIYYLEERDEETLSKRILMLSRLNKVRSALSLYRSMELSGLLPNSHACNSLLACLLRNRRLDDALKVFKFVKLSGIITGHTYSLILKAVANARSRDEALSIFQEAERDSKTNNCLDIVVYNTMIAIFGRVNDWVLVERLWKGLQDNRLVGTVVTYQMLVCIFVRCGKNELALDAHHEMVQNGLTPDEDVMEAIIGACTREGKWDMAFNVLQSMLSSEMKPSLTACNALINSLGKAARVELAFKVYGLIKSLGYTPDAYTWNALLGALNNASRHADALHLFEHIREEHSSVLNMHIYNTCLMSCKRLRVWDQALQLLWQMEASGIPVSVMSYNLVIAACENAREPKIALEVYAHMVEKNISPDLFTLLSLIRGCIWGSLWDEMEEILNYAPNGSVYNAAIQGVCLRRKTDLARKLYRKMREIGLKPDGKTRALMLQNLPKR